MFLKNIRVWPMCGLQDFPISNVLEALRGGFVESHPQFE